MWKNDEQYLSIGDLKQVLWRSRMGWDEEWEHDDHRNNGDTNRDYDGVNHGKLKKWKIMFFLVQVGIKCRFRMI